MMRERDDPKIVNFFESFLQSIDAFEHEIDYILEKYLNFELSFSKTKKVALWSEEADENCVLK